MSNPSSPVSPYASTGAPDAGIPAAGPNSLARASFVIAVVLVVFAIGMFVFNQFVPLLMQDLGLNIDGIGVLFAASAFIELVLGGIGVVLGALGARRGDALVQAGIGMGAGGFVAITALVSLLVTPIMGLIY